MDDLINARILEIDASIKRLYCTPKRSQTFHHLEEISELEGEIKGLKWVKIHCLCKSDKNLIEQ